MKRDKNKLTIGKVRITASRFPWQSRSSMAMLSDPKTEGVGTKYGWRGTSGMGRFGGGWNWCLGFRLGGKTIYIELLVGAIRISWYPERKPPAPKASPAPRAMAGVTPTKVVLDEHGDDVPF